MRRLAATLALLALFSTAAPATPVAVDPLTDRQRILHFLDRAGFGWSEGDVDRIEKQGFFFYVDQQLHAASLDDSKCERRLAQFSLLRQSPKDLAFNYMGQGEAKNRMARHQPVPADPREPRDILTALAGQKLIRAVYSTRQLQEVMVDFWMNHFNIDWDKNQDRWLLPSFERDVIRKHALGRFRDLLGATAHSPAMLIYLDNWRSSKLVPADCERPQPSGGINENYARELMELHTLGVDGGYTQHDIIEVARCLTGWTVGPAAKGWPFLYDPKKHDDGKKIVLGTTLPAGGGEQDGERVLDLLARHRSTAHFLATELCRYFVSDNPPARLVNQVAAVYLRTDGDIAATLRTILEARDFWSPEAFHAKVKSPFYLLASAIRASDGNISDTRALQGELGRLGMPPYQCEPPTGYKDDGVTWVSTGSLLERLNFCSQLADNGVKGTTVDLSGLQHRVSATAPVPNLLNVLLAGEVTPSTRADLERVATPPLSADVFPRLVGMILGSPDFQRR